MKSYSREQREDIVREYRAGVAAGGGGGMEVAKRYGIHSSSIIGWERTMQKNGNGNGGGSRAVRVTPAVAPVVTTAPAFEELIGNLDAVIEWHATKAEYFRKMRDAVAAV